MGQGLKYRMAGAELRLLLGPVQIIRCQGFRHDLAAVSIHNANACRAQTAGGLHHMGKHGQTRIEADPAAQTAWAQEVADMAETTLFTKANSWYMGANVPGKPRVFMMYIGGLDRYVDRVEDIVQAGYQGFVLSGPAQGGVSSPAQAGVPA